MSLHVLNTRPTDRAAALSLALLAAGHRVTPLPLLGFQTCELSPHDQAQLLALASYDAVIVVSPIAAELGLTHCTDVLGDCAHVHWIAVGQATAALLRAAGLAPVVPQLETSEGVLALAEFQQLATAARVMVWRGVGGRELITQTLLQHGTTLCSVALYARYLPPSSVQQWQQIDPQSIDVVLISSGEAWQNWQILAKNAAQRPYFLLFGQRLQADLAHLAAQIVPINDLSPLTIVQALHRLKASQSISTDLTPTWRASDAPSPH